MRNLLCTALVAELGCWSASAPAPVTPAPETNARLAPRSPEACTEGGEQLHLRTCRKGDSLVWTITNRTNVPLWAFIAPQGTKIGMRSRENVLARIHHGDLVLSKLELPLFDGERHPVGAVLLEPGQSDEGVVPVGNQLDPRAANITGARIEGTRWVRSVALEIGFAERLGRDQATPTKPEPLVVVGNFQRKRQEIVRAPAVPWQ